MFLKTAFIYITIFVSLSAQASVRTARIALEWMDHPPYSPYAYDGPKNMRQEDAAKENRKFPPNLGGANWDLSCIGFVSAVMLEARAGIGPESVKGRMTKDFADPSRLPTLQYYLKSIAYYDMPLMIGFPGFLSRIGDTNEKIGNVPRSFRAMVDAGRGFTDVKLMPPGAAVFLSLPHFKEGHIAIFSGSYDIDGEPLLVSTGAPASEMSDLVGIRLLPLSFFTKTLKGTFLGWAEIDGPWLAPLPEVNP